ncbi:MAG: CarD family transcriptional regulator [Alphaproteobacteria bacterium]|nr:CarD family transcriptional regulator [Alphaproteobacteria bacterium]|tara:strand:+ start:763 stop:1494 length:732 start_codon:yes stop_codon:yes gene_type:complete
MAKATAKSTTKPKAKSKSTRPKAAAVAPKVKAKPKSNTVAKTTAKSAAKTAPKPAKKAAPKATTKTAPKTAQKTASKPKAPKLPFAVNDYVVYPTHGVGKITGVEKQEISGMDLELFVVEFDKDKMVLRVPLAKAEGSGMRKLSTPQKMTNALSTLKGRARIKRTMWSRRAQEYEAKINSGDPVSIAEVIRDLHRSANQPEQSYSERQIYEAALERLARELAAVERIDEDAATERLEGMLRAA